MRLSAFGLVQVLVQHRQRFRVQAQRFGPVLLLQLELAHGCDDERDGAAEFDLGKLDVWFDGIGEEERLVLGRREGSVLG